MIKKLLLIMTIASSAALGLLLGKIGQAEAMVFHTRWGEWTDTSECMASQCGTTEGTKTQSRSCEKGGEGFECSLGHWECDKSCPTVIWETQESECPGPNEAYTSTDNKKPCKRKWNVPGDGNRDDVWRYTDKVVTKSFGPITFTYDKSNDPNKCHRPTASSQEVPAWAVNDYNHDNPEWKNVVDTNCRMVDKDTESRTVACKDAEVIECEVEPTPTPTAEPTPTPEPESKSEKKFKSSTDCEGVVRLEFKSLSDDGTPSEGKSVRFLYNNKIVEAQTNDEGKAKAKFDYAGELKAKVEYDGKSKSTMVKAAENCPAVLGATTGKVLGTTTLAATGFSADAIMNLLGFSGMALTAIGYRKYGKKN